MHTNGRRFLFLLGSARHGGNTETLARHAAEQLGPEVEQQWLHLADHVLLPFQDLRHAGGFATPAGTEKLLLDATLAATDIVLATPLYWYTVSASTKNYLDYWTAWMRDPELNFKPSMREKTLWGVSVFADDDLKYMQPLETSMRFGAEYLDMRWGGLLIGNGTAPDDVLRDEQALADAKTFFG